jgi:hypothetical protein
MTLSPDFQAWAEEHKWQLHWKPTYANLLTSAAEIHNYSLLHLHITYPLMKREQNYTSTLEGSNIQRISCNISSTLPGNSITSSNKQDITSYNEDLEAYIKYIRGGSKLYDGVQNLGKDVVVAVAPPRRNGIPWFGRVIDFNNETKQVMVRWMDKVQDKTIYFYLTTNNSEVHYETIICSGVEFEPVLGDRLMWKMVTPLAFIQSMNNVDAPELQQSNSQIAHYQKRNVFDLTQMVFSSITEFLEFVKMLK